MQLKPTIFPVKALASICDHHLLFANNLNPNGYKYPLCYMFVIDLQPPEVETPNTLGRFICVLLMSFIILVQYFYLFLNKRSMVRNYCSKTTTNKQTNKQNPNTPGVWVQSQCFFFPRWFGNPQIRRWLKLEDLIVRNVQWIWRSNWQLLSECILNILKLTVQPPPQGHNGNMDVVPLPISTRNGARHLQVGVPNHCCVCKHLRVLWLNGWEHFKCWIDDVCNMLGLSLNIGSMYLTSQRSRDQNCAVHLKWGLPLFSCSGK